MESSGIILALCTALSWAICIFPFTEASRRLGSNTVNHVRLLMALTLLSVLLFVNYLFYHTSPFNAPITYWIFLALSGVVGLAIGDHFSFSAFTILGPRIGSLFSCITPGLVLILSMILLNDSINWIGIAGIIVTMSGIAYVILGKNTKQQVSDKGFGTLNKGILFGFLSSLTGAVGLVFSKIAMGFHQAQAQSAGLQAAWIRMLFATIVLFCVSLFQNRLATILKPALKNKDKALQYTFAGTLFGPVIGVSLSMYTIFCINVSIAQTIFSLVPVLTIPIAWIFYREKITLKSVMGALIAIAGVVLVIWRNELSALLLK